MKITKEEFRELVDNGESLKILELARENKLDTESLYHKPILTQKEYNNNLKWIEALRSGEFSQTKGILGDCETGMCCLGVANHVLNFGLYPTWGNLSYKLHVPEAEINREYARNCPSEEKAYQELGLITGSGESVLEEFYSSLVEMNDSRLFTFDQIADMIEASLTLVKIGGVDCAKGHKE